MESSDRVPRNLDHGPRSYTDQVLEMLKDKATAGDKFCPPDANECHGRRGRKVSFKRGRESESVDGLPSGLRRHAKYAAEQPADRVKPESKTPKRLLKRNSAVDVEVLKEEMEDVKKTLASLQSLLTERYKKKRVSFAEDLH
ncbi:uncharacterized protein N7506_003247 [Penicillium brevicompactum]|uniref:uncharacterized protein n=1 Tax=Penicillium brevicompactum TaxID=5074 RepID=UPI002540EB61|nr:uncharacterized protein N7506_003247 [Penicillium brevicompactum]KAJ5343423.1 hypothetical protein N7506_003247 [Penicillium brevicompactum]